MSHDPTEESFLRDVATHQMTVLRDDGVYRHIRFSRPGSGTYRFDLVTWPGYLAYTGDMGCYVFSRLDDMFQFFRTDRKHLHMKDGQTLAINLGYWSEKLQATDSSGRHGGSAVEFSEDKFRDVINEYRKGWIGECRERGVSKEERRELWESVDSEVLDRIGDHGESVTTCAYEFSHKCGKQTFSFDDLFEHDFTRFTYHFIWCCYALAWGIQKYDEQETSA